MAFILVLSLAVDTRLIDLCMFLKSISIELQISFGNYREWIHFSYMCVPPTTGHQIKYLVPI